MENQDGAEVICPVLIHSIKENPVGSFIIVHC